MTGNDPMEILLDPEAKLISTDRRAHRTTADALGLVHANQAVMDANLKSLEAKLTARLDTHSEEIQRNSECLTRAITVIEERVRKESAARVLSEHRAIERQKELLDGLATWNAGMASFQVAVSGLQETVATMQGRVAGIAAEHQKDMKEAADALKKHGKDESWLTKSVYKLLALSVVATALITMAFTNRGMLIAILEAIKIK